MQLPRLSMDWEKEQANEDGKHGDKSTVICDSQQAIETKDCGNSTVLDSLFIGKVSCMPFRLAVRTLI